MLSANKRYSNCSRRMAYPPGILVFHSTYGLPFSGSVRCSGVFPAVVINSVENSLPRKVQTAMLSELDVFEAIFQKLRVFL